jgi:hypothetical protein
VARNRSFRHCGVLGGLLAPFLIQGCQDGNPVCQPVPADGGTIQEVCYEVGDFGQSTLAITMPEPPGDNCPAGGKRIDTGFDDNDNGQLDANEVDASTYVCDGIAGDPGADGRSALAVMTPEVPGGNCANGGLRFDYGVDDDANGELDDAEIEGTRYVCPAPMASRVWQASREIRVPRGWSARRAHLVPRASGKTGYRVSSVPRALAG